LRCRTGPVKWRRSRSRRDAVGALDRSRETPTLDHRVRGVVPPHPVPSGERLFLIFPPPPPVGTRPRGPDARGRWQFARLLARGVVAADLRADLYGGADLDGGPPRGAPPRKSPASPSRPEGLVSSCRQDSLSGASRLRNCLRCHWHLFARLLPLGHFPPRAGAAYGRDLETVEKVVTLSCTAGCTAGRLNVQEHTTPRARLVH
jgi:hypothetical protein